MKPFSGTRRPAVAGQFYPGDPAQLRQVVDQCLAAAAATPDARLRAIIAPHAGYTYSGATAGQLYARLQGRRDLRRVVVIAPSHRVGFRGLSTASAASFATPLGTIPVDQAACAALVAANPLFSQRDDAHAREHSLEVHLPFLQRVLPAFELVPLVCGLLDDQELRAAARTLKEQLWRTDTLWVISSDFTHYGQAFDYLPFERDIEKNLEALDRGAIAHILARDVDGFLKYVQETGATICGRLPIAILLAALGAPEPTLAVELVDYTTSGKLTGDFAHSVSYAAIAVRQTGPAAEQPAEQPADDGAATLPEADRKLLLELARQAIRSRLDGTPPPAPALATLSPTLLQNGAAFVTLHLDGNLRGCIGNILPEEPLYLNVINNARNAAFRDPRFQPLSKPEFAKIQLEISVLTPPRRIASADEFEVGRHGILLSKRGRRSVFLPQVAAEQGWDRETTLTHLALKAGLAADDWRQGTTFEVFEAIVFHE